MLLAGKMPENKQFLKPVENIPRYSNSKICLFGKPDTAFTEKIISDHFAGERQRILERWGFDILTEKFKSPKNLEKCRRRLKKAMIEDKENISINVESERTLVDVGDVMKEKLENNKKNSLKMTNDRQHLRKARQAQVTDFWRSRKISESSSSSDKEH